MKAPDGGHVDGRASMHRHMDIGQARRYEHAGRQAGVRIPAVIAGARSAEQSAFINIRMAGGTCHPLFNKLTREAWQCLMWWCAAPAVHVGLLSGPPAIMLLRIFTGRLICCAENRAPPYSMDFQEKDIMLLCKSAIKRLNINFKGGEKMVQEMSNKELITITISRYAELQRAKQSKAQSLSIYFKDFTLPYLDFP